MNNRRAVILVADDDSGDRLLIQGAFQKISPESCIHVTEDGDGVIAYLAGAGQYADRHKYPFPTFIITDLKMPRVDGFALLEKVKANPAWSTIPVVVFSASCDAEDVRTAYLLGASSYHVKPCGYANLSHFVRVLYEYWMNCELPRIEVNGTHVRTHRHGTIGSCYPRFDRVGNEKIPGRVDGEEHSK